MEPEQVSVTILAESLVRLCFRTGFWTSSRQQDVFIRMVFPWKYGCRCENELINVATLYFSIKAIFEGTPVTIVLMAFFILQKTLYALPLPSFWVYLPCFCSAQIVSYRYQMEWETVQWFPLSSHGPTSHHLHQKRISQLIRRAWRHRRIMVCLAEWARRHSVRQTWQLPEAVATNYENDV